MKLLTEFKSIAGKSPLHLYPQPVSITNANPSGLADVLLMEFLS